MRISSFFSLFAFGLSMVASHSWAATALHCVTKDCTADQERCVRLKAVVHVGDHGDAWVQVTRKYDGSNDTYYNGPIFLSQDRASCSLNAVEAQRTPKEFSMNVDVKKGEAFLGMLVHGEPLPDHLSAMTCVSDEAYQKKEFPDCTP